MSKLLTDDRFALLSVWKIFLPWAAAVAEPINRAPTEHTDRRRMAFSEEGRKDGACTIGNTGLNRTKYNLIQRFYLWLGDPELHRRSCQGLLLTRKSAEGSAVLLGYGCSLHLRPSL